MRNKREHIQRAVVLILAVAGLITCTAPFLTSSGLASAQAAAPTWSFTGSLNTVREVYTTTLLPNGKVLVAGGLNTAGYLVSAELYDPVTGTWRLTGGPHGYHVYHTATLLTNGKVLFVGGSTQDASNQFLVANSAELYDPAAGTWSFTGNLNVARDSHSATLLSDGKVLVAGGIGSGQQRPSAELYDPPTGTWSTTGNLNTVRFLHTATLLQNGKVLVAGGTQGEFSSDNLNSSELYDPNTGTWSLTGSLNVARLGHTETLLPNGNVLVTGGESQDWAVINKSAELYNPATGTWSYTGSLSTARIGHTATLLPNRQVLVAGGAFCVPGDNRVHCTTLDSAEIYDPATGNWSATVSLNGPRYRHGATLLQSGKILVVGGYDGTPFGTLRTAELYDSGSSSTSSPTPTPTPTATPTPVPSPTPAPATNGKIAFTSDRDGNREIYLMNADGTNQVRLTNNSVVDDYPTWSPDGTKIAFVSQMASAGFAIFMMNADGTNKVEITPINDGECPISWSPDGNRIAFQDIRNWDIFVVNADGSNRHNLTNGIEPSWSPDGSKILFTRVVSGGPILHTIRPDGTDLQALPNGFRIDGFGDFSPQWSPSGDKIVFLVNVWDFYTVIFTANADGTNRQFLDGCPTSYCPDGDDRGAPHWSPDGTKVVFHISNRFHTRRDIYARNTDGTGFVQLTDGPGRNINPSWQPLVSAACPNPIDCADFFVRQQYLDFLNREPDAPGLAHWAGEITACNDPSRRQPGESLARCVERKRPDTSAAFFLSPEFQYTGYFVYRLYKGSLVQNGAGRFPTYQEFLRDVRQVASGIIQNNQLSATAIEANKKTFAEQFTQRPEFRSLYDPLSNFDYVERLFQITGINVSANDKQALVNALNNQMETRASVLQKVVDGTVVIAEGNQQFTTAYGRAFYEKEFNAAFVLMEYFGYLQRDPDAPGYQFWLGKLNFYGNFNDAEMVKSFITSPEYRGRFGQP